MREAYVGIYWTLPVNWAGFRDLPPNVDAAAAASRTIRYQRERVLRHLDQSGGELVHEIAFMDTRPDRATDAIRDVLERHAPSFVDARPTLLIVHFQEERNWRPNPFIHHAAATLRLRLTGLSPDPLVIGGQVFDPARHFAAWRKRDGTEMVRLRLAAEDGLRTALAQTAEGEGRWQTVADALNTRQVKTIRGVAWTPGNVRTLARRIARTSVAGPAMT